MDLKKFEHKDLEERIYISAKVEFDNEIEDAPTLSMEISEPKKAKPEKKITYVNRKSSKGELF